MSSCCALRGIDAAEMRELASMHGGHYYGTDRYDRHVVRVDDRIEAQEVYYHGQDFDNKHVYRIPVARP